MPQTEKAQYGFGKRTALVHRTFCAGVWPATAA